MTAAELTRVLRRLGACEEAREWAANKDLTTAWAECQRPDWMLWLLDALGYSDQSTLRLYACWCARQVWHLPSDERSRAAVEVAERYARGEATDDELSAAWAAWDAARDAAWAAWDAAGAAAATAQADRLREMVPLAEVERLMEEAATNDSD